MSHVKLSQRQIRISDPTTGYDKRVLVKRFTLPNGMPEVFFVDNDKDSVQVFALTKSNQVLTVVQWRPGIEEVQCELPGGGVEPGEDLDKAASRELREECGHVPGKLTHLASINYSPYTTGKRHMYMATECEKTGKGLDLDPNEFLRLKIWSLEDFREQMKLGKVRGFDGAYMALDRLGMLS